MFGKQLWLFLSLKLYHQVFVTWIGAFQLHVSYWRVQRSDRKCFFNYIRFKPRKNCGTPLIIAWIDGEKVRNPSSNLLPQVKPFSQEELRCWNSGLIEMSADNQALLRGSRMVDWSVKQQGMGYQSDIWLPTGWWFGTCLIIFSQELGYLGWWSISNIWL